MAETPQPEENRVEIQNKYLVRALDEMLAKERKQVVILTALVHQQADQLEQQAITIDRMQAQPAPEEAAGLG